MHFLKKNRLKRISLIFILFLLVGTVTTVAYADAAPVIPLNHGGTRMTARITNYSGDDTNPPSDLIDWPASAGYPTVHNKVGGSGTFADPITVAINSKNGPNGDVPHGPFTIGEKFYLPVLHLYFVAEDSCNIDIAYNICTDHGSDKDDNTQLHMDLFNGDSDNRSGLLACELSYGGETDVIANAGEGYPMPEGYPNGTSLFDSASGTCVGAALWHKYQNWTVGASTSSPTPTGNTNEGNSPLKVDDSVTGTEAAQFDYHGDGWHHCQDCDYDNVGFYHDSNSWDSTPGDYVQITFTGTQIKLYGVKGTHHGIANFSLDAGAEVQEDFYAPAEAGSQLIYISPTLDPSQQHTLKVTVTGQQNADAATSHINPDYVEIASNTTTGTLPTGGVSGTPYSTAQTGKDAFDLTASDSHWTSLWRDDFGSNSVDTSKWTIRSYPAGFVNHELECYRTDSGHVSIAGSGAESHLVLKADQSNESGCSYISGRLDTQGKYEVPAPTSGKPMRIEASMQLPAGGNGIWPAFWMLGHNIDSVGWPNCGEIDIMESSGLRNMSAATIQATVHGLNNNSDGGRETLESGTFSDGYHLIGMDWYTDHIDFFVDGHMYKTVSTASRGGDAVFHQPFFIILNFAVGGDWPGNPDGTTFPQQMNVKFVRVYQHR